MKKFLGNSQKQHFFPEFTFDYFRILPHWGFWPEKKNLMRQYPKKKPKVASWKNLYISIFEKISSPTHWYCWEIFRHQKICEIGACSGRYLMCFRHCNIGGSPRIWGVTPTRTASVFMALGWLPRVIGYPSSFEFDQTNALCLLLHSSSQEPKNKGHRLVALLQLHTWMLARIYQL